MVQKPKVVCGQKVVSEIFISLDSYFQGLSAGQKVVHPSLKVIDEKLMVVKKTYVISSSNKGPTSQILMCKMS